MTAARGAFIKSVVSAPTRRLQTGRGLAQRAGPGRAAPSCQYELYRKTPSAAASVSSSWKGLGFTEQNRVETQRKSARGRRGDRTRLRSVRPLLRGTSTS